MAANEISISLDYEDVICSNIFRRTRKWIIKFCGNFLCKWKTKVAVVDKGYHFVLAGVS